jgi:apolipoprotein N-acyltransferase
VLLALSFPKYGHPAFAWIAITPLVVAIALEARSGHRELRVVWLGVVTGTVYFWGTVYWVVHVMSLYGGFGWPIALGIGILMVAYLSIFVTLFAVAFGHAVGRGGMAGVWLAPWLWVASEWARSSIGLGFPWVLLGSSQASVLPIVQLASVTGVYGVSWLAALVGTAAAAVVLSRGRAHLYGAMLVVVCFAAVAVGGAIRIARGTLTAEGVPFRVGLVQGNVEQDAKWNPAFENDIMTRHIDLSRQALQLGAQLVVWPESSTPFYFNIEAARAEPVRRLAEQANTAFLIGTDEFDRAGGVDHYYNAAVLVGTDGRSQGAYHKMALVPFGEYVPLKHLLFFVGPLVQAVSDFSPGTDPHVFNVGGHGVSVSICYESTYPWISRAFVERGSELLATVTNDAWFGTTSAPYQHFDQGAIRAVEEGRYVVRAANTGISGAVDPYGRVLVATPIFQTRALAVDVRLLSDRTIYSRVGDLVVWLSLAVVGWIVADGWLVRRSRRDRDRRRPATSPALSSRGGV